MADYDAGCLGLPSCEEGRVLGILPALFELIQTAETVKIPLGKGTTHSGQLLLYEARAMRFRELELRKALHASPITAEGGNTAWDRRIGPALPTS